MKAVEQKMVGKFQEWTYQPRTFVQDVYGLDGSEGKRISSQQEQLLDAYGLLINAKLKRARGVPLTPRELEVVDKIGIAVHSGHGTGKTSGLSWCVEHFLMTRPYAKIPCVAPVGPQLKANLWPELHVWLRKSEFLQQYIQWQAEKVYFKELQGKEWYAYPRSVNVKASPEEQAETLAGAHADNMMICVDEASGVPDPVYRPLEGGLTGPCNIVMMIGNVTRNYGYFFEAITKHRRDWIVLHWDAEDSELVSPSHIARMARKYGKDSNAYRIRVKGLPPLATPDTLIPWEWVMNATMREFPHDPYAARTLGIDCARYGDDDSCIARVVGPTCTGLETFKKLDTRELGAWALTAMQDHEAQSTCIDVIGWGAGTYDYIKDVGMVTPVNVAESASDPEQFMRLRDEVWWMGREEFQQGLVAIPNDDELIGQLTTPKYNFDKRASEKIKVESKQELRDRGVASPNKADAYLLARYAKRFTGVSVPRRRQPARRMASVWVG